MGANQFSRRKRGFDLSSPYRASIVIPACNEANVVSRCLDALGTDRLLVVVVANGCTDRTAEVARRLGVSVVELDTPSKIAALNAGDAAAVDVFPRIYLDADIELSGRDAGRVAEELRRSDTALVAAPMINFEQDRASWAVRAFFRMYQRMSYISDGVIGSGCYAVNAAGRARWGEFPDVTADDLFVQGLFAPTERRVVEDTRFLSRTPRTLGALMRVRTRTYAGNREAQRRGLAGHMADSSRTSATGLLSQVLRQPWRALDATIYLGVNLAARVRAASRVTSSSWLRDETTRV